MNLLITNVKIADPGSDFNNQVCDVSIENGAIKSIAKNIPLKGKETVFNGEGAILSPGFLDLNCAAGDPGYETREDLQTVIAAAKAGGYTGVTLMPGTKPVVQTKSAIEYILNKTRGALVDVYPIGAVSVNLEGKELAELFDMHTAGAIAFSDGDRAIKDDGFMSRALHYALGFGGLILSHPENSAMTGKAQVNESMNSIMLGMKGIPALAEEMHVARDLFLAGYHGSPIHISTISTSGSVNLIRKAKKDGLPVTCDVAAHHLLFTEELLEGFDSNYKVKPPLRGKADVKALLAGIKDGTIDAVCSQHMPHEIEFKAVEFEAAVYGIIALQTVLPMLIAAGLNATQIAEKLAVAPRKILSLQEVTVNIGNKANFVVYNPSKTWEFNAHSNQSKSHNSPLMGTLLTGKVLLTVNNDQFIKYE